MLPSRLEELDPEWLSARLARSFPGAVVSDVHIERQAGGTNSNARLALAYDRDAGAPATIFVKMPSTRRTQRMLVHKSGMAEREVGFYRDVAGSIALRYPRAYATEYEPESGNFVLLLEDVGRTGGRFLQTGGSIPFETARRAVEDLADLHLAYRLDPALRTRSAWVGPQIRLREYGAGMLSMALEGNATGLEDVFKRVARFYIDNHDAVQDAWEDGAWSLVHGDAHWGNLFLDGDRIGFFDWGCMAFMPGMRDVGYFLCMGLPVEDRRRYERELIGLYVDRIAAGGGPELSFDDAWVLHCLHAAYTVPAAAPASIYPLVKDEVDFDASFVAEFLRRASAAVEDLDALGALRVHVPA